VALAGLVLVGAAPVSASEITAYVVTIQTLRGSYRAVIHDPVMVQKAWGELASGEDVGVPTGPLAPGDGGVNVGHRWHVTELSFADFTMELCDGTARMVDQNPSDRSGHASAGPDQQKRDQNEGGGAGIGQAPGDSPTSRRATPIAVRTRRAVAGARWATTPAPARPSSSRVISTRRSSQPSQSSTTDTTQATGDRSSSPLGWSSMAKSIDFFIR